MKLCQSPPAELKRMGATAAEVLARTLSQEILTARFCDSLESALLGVGRG